MNIGTNGPPEYGVFTCRLRAKAHIRAAFEPGTMRLQESLRKWLPKICLAAQPTFIPLAP
jgi:hypothetical protein